MAEARASSLAQRWSTCQHIRTRAISWIKAARKDFGSFPLAAQERIKAALDIAAAGQIAGIAKPLKGFDAGVIEIALAFKSDAYRAVYALKLGDDIWVVHAFQKKSTRGIATPKHEIDLVHDRIRQVRRLI